MNLGTLAALILIVSPVWGLRPVRAFRLLTLNVPKPVSVSLSPFFKALGDRAEKRRDRVFRLPFPDPRLCANGLDQFRLRHLSNLLKFFYNVPGNREKRRSEVVFINPERRPRVKG